MFPSIPSSSLTFRSGTAPEFCCTELLARGRRCWSEPWPKTAGWTSSASRSPGRWFVFFREDESLLNVCLSSLQGPELLSKYIGASEQGVRDLFRRLENVSTPLHPSFETVFLWHVNLITSTVIRSLPLLPVSGPKPSNLASCSLTSLTLWPRGGATTAQESRTVWSISSSLSWTGWRDYKVPK